MTSPAPPAGPPPEPVPGPPPPPPGPGVQPPFAAAPVEGRSARLWLGLGVAGALLVLCCGGGLVSITGLVVTSVQALDEQAQRAVADYLDAEIESAWEDAYQQLCEQDRQAETLAQYRQRVAQLPRIEDYTLGSVAFTPAGEVQLPADVEYVDGGSERLRVPLLQNPQTGAFEVCGLRR